MAGGGGGGEVAYLPLSLGDRRGEMIFFGIYAAKQCFTKGLTIYPVHVLLHLYFCGYP